LTKIFVYIIVATHCTLKSQTDFKTLAAFAVRFLMSVWPFTQHCALTLYLPTVPDSSLLWTILQQIAAELFIAKNYQVPSVNKGLIRCLMFCDWMKWNGPKSLNITCDDEMAFWCYCGICQLRKVESILHQVSRRCWIHWSSSKSLQ